MTIGVLRKFRMLSNFANDRAGCMVRCCEATHARSVMTLHLCAGLPELNGYDRTFGMRMNVRKLLTLNKNIK